MERASGRKGYMWLPLGKGKNGTGQWKERLHVVSLTYTTCVSELHANEMVAFLLITFQAHPKTH